MDERKNTKKPKANAAFDAVAFVCWMQILVCVLVGLILVLAVKLNPDAGDALRRDFQRLMQVQIAADDVKDVFAKLGDHLRYRTRPDALQSGAAMTDVSSAPTEEAAVAPTTTQPVSSAPTQATTAPTEAPSRVEVKNVVKTTEIVHPVDSGNYTSYFGYRTNPITQQYAFHTGLDIAVPLGTEVKAAYDGTVRKVGRDSRSGNYIILSHGGGTETFYCHCSKILASEGDAVNAGDCIALVGSTGWSTGPHLHFEIRKDGERMDPLPILNGHDD